MSFLRNCLPVRTLVLALVVIGFGFGAMPGVAFGVNDYERHNGGEGDPTDGNDIIGGGGGGYTNDSESSKPISTTPISNTFVIHLPQLGDCLIVPKYSNGQLELVFVMQLSGRLK